MTYHQSGIAGAVTLLKTVWNMSIPSTSMKEMQNGTRIKELSWDRNIELKSKIVYPFSGLVELIKGIVYSHPEFWKLPDQIDGYF